MINELILRLGIFKYWISRNPNFFENTLRTVGITDNTNINLNKDAKFEFYLSKIYDCIIKKDKNIEKFRNECKNLLDKETNDDIILINSSRLFDLYNEANTLFEKDKTNKFYFLLENPLNNKYKSTLNSNFCLTQKLLGIIPSNFDVDFESNLFDIFKENNKLINISFLYLSSKKYRFEMFKICNEKKMKKININIKLLILGYLDNEEKFDKEDLLTEGIENIIFLSNNNIINFDEKVENYDNKSYYYFFEKYFIQFIHFFIFLMTSKYELKTIKDAFDKAKNNFINKFKRIYESNQTIQKDDLLKTEDKLQDENKYKNIILSIKNLIQMESINENYYFKIESIDDKQKLNNQQKIIKDIYNEDEYKYNQIKNIYYRKNPFSELNESKLKKKTKNIIKLPGFDSLGPQNFFDFVEKEIYDVNNDINILEDLVNKNKLLNIFGKNNVFDLGDELCKYFYMTGKFKGGIYIVSPSYFEEEKNSLKVTIEFNYINDSKKKILILSKVLNQDINLDDINKFSNYSFYTKTYLIICSENKLQKLESFNYCDLNSLAK